MNDKTREAIRNHGQQLLAIFPNAKEREPLELCRRLRRLEGEAARFALRGCNGPAWESEEARDKAGEKILAKVNDLLGNVSQPLIPVFLNGDPRGYSLKIKDEYMRSSGARLDTDWGGYGILAPEIK